MWIPVLPGHYNPHNTGRELLDHREHAMARSTSQAGSSGRRTPRASPPWSMGTMCSCKTCNHTRRWERTGKVVECKEFDQYRVKVDGTGRSTWRNRKYLMKFQPNPKHPRLSTLPVPNHARTTPEPCPSTTTTYDHTCANPPTISTRVVWTPCRVGCFPSSNVHTFPS